MPAPPKGFISQMYTFYEFFAGGGMVRAALSAKWDCVFANDNDPHKTAAYRTNWRRDYLLEGDIRDVSARDLPGAVDLAWASFPCQDLSLAGVGAGLNGARSSTFWPFWELVRELRAEDRAPRMLVLENVYGALRSHGGKDFTAIAQALAEGGYRFGAMIVDAALFLPQSRPRLFVVAVDESIAVPTAVAQDGPDSLWHPKAVTEAHDRLPRAIRRNWVWWSLPRPSQRGTELADIVEGDSGGVPWHAPEETVRLLSMMTEVNQAKVREAKRAGRLKVGAVYKRTRQGMQRAEVRFDLAGCLRTPAGGSSRQTLLFVDGEDIRSRLLTPREAARLMGLPDQYTLPTRYNAAYHLAGDGVAVPVVRHLAEHLCEPLLAEENQGMETANEHE